MNYCNYQELKVSGLLLGFQTTLVGAQINLKK